jgi:fructose-1,6-bisphosphatase/inositol monophosphatase family enzyme
MGVARLDKNGLEVLGGAVRDPVFNGGVLFSGSREGGTITVIGGDYKKEGDAFTRYGGVEIEAKVIGVASMKDALVIFNPDVSLTDKYPVLHVALGDISPGVRTSYILESCGGSMGRVATGWAHGIVHSPISPEHYIGGLAVLEGAGAKVIFYELDEAGRPVRLEKLEVKNMLPRVRSTGFVAGTEPVAEALIEALIKAGRRI